jgi:hypothetical protein
MRFGIGIYLTKYYFCMMNKSRFDFFFKTRNLSKHITLIISFCCLAFNSFSQTNSIEKLISSKGWDSLFPKRAGTYGTHPQGYTTDFYSYKNLHQAASELADYFVIIRTKKGVWGQRITVTRKSTLKTYIYSDVESWWYSNSTPETIVVVDFADFINESSQTNNKRELAAFLANISKETTGGWETPVGGGSAGDYAQWGLYFVHEVGYTKSNGAGTYSQKNSEYPPDSTVGYYGRGPIQLSWNYNYGQFSKFIYNDKNVLLKYPDSLQQNGVLAFKSAIWFWMMPQCPKPSCHQVMHDQWLHDNAYSSSKMYYKGFAHTNNIINGGLECRTNSSSSFTQKVVLRSKLYKYYLGIMGFNSSGISKEDSLGYSTLCYSSSSNAMEDYTNCKVVNSYYGSLGIDTQIVCGSLVWIDGKTYTKNTKTATYNIVKGDKNGNDSLVVLDLTIKPIAKSVENQKACHSFKWINGITYTSNTDLAVYRISGAAVNGCDSLVTLHLEILPEVFGMDSHTVCNSYTWINGKTYTSNNDSATYRLTGAAANGCDSIVKLKLKILPIAKGIDSRTACESFTWINGITYTANNDSAEYRMVNGAANGCDSMVRLKLKILSPSVGIDSQTACKAFTWINGKTYTKNKDTATYRIKGGAANGCDSLVTLHLSITNIDVSVIRDSLVLKATPNGDSYQWVDCENGFTKMNGQTNPFFIVEKNGKYAVIITRKGCVDTSDCYTISHLGLNNIQKVDYLVVYPNPAKGIFLVDFSKTATEPYFITDNIGKVIKSDYLNHGVNEISLENELNGVYFLIVGGHSIKLIKYN